MNAYDETRTLRRRLGEDEQGFAPDRTTGCCTTIVGITTEVDTYPTTAGRYYALLPVRITGQVGEGIEPTLTAGTKPFLALNLGSEIPPEDTYVIASNGSGRFTFRYDG